jgi:hypothetical protein
MVRSIGFAGSGALMAGLTFVAAVIPIIWLQWKAPRIREARMAKEDGISRAVTSRV